jgi:hypothetical protein
MFIPGTNPAVIQSFTSSNNGFNVHLLSSPKQSTKTVNFPNILPAFLSHMSNDNVIVPGDQKFSVHLMITTPKVTSNVQILPRQSPDIY